MINSPVKTISFFLFFGLITVIASLAILSCKSGERSTEVTSVLRLYIGSYSSEEDPGINVYEFNIPDNEFKKIQSLNGQRNPSFLAINPEAGYLYAVNEVADHKGDRSGAVSAFSIDKTTGMLTFINRQSSLGAGPCHVSVLPDGKHVAVANYSGGSLALIPVSGDGSLETPSGFVQLEGSGPDPRRQRAPHAHSIYPYGNSNTVFAADLGNDKVMIYNTDSNGEFHPGSQMAYVSMEPGAGPRHLAIHPDGNWVYVVNELNSTITRLLVDNVSGGLIVKESVSTLPDDFEGNNYCADIRIHPGGMFLYASNRGHNSIAIYDITDDGTPVLTGHAPSGGEWPRNFNIEPSGRRMFVANQNTGNVVVFEINPDTGQLYFTGAELIIDKPVCIEFFVQ
jgi:6-phosphogluconolactonase